MFEHSRNLFSGLIYPNLKKTKQFLMVNNFFFGGGEQVTSNVYSFFNGTVNVPLNVKLISSQIIINI